MLKTDRREAIAIFFFFLMIRRPPRSTLFPSRTLCRSGICRTHIDDPHRLNASSRWLDAEEARALAALDAAPEFLFRRQKKVLIERIGWYLDLDPLAAAGDNREHRGRSVGDPHVMLELGHVLFRRRLLRERPGQHEFGFD